MNVVSVGPVFGRPNMSGRLKTGPTDRLNLFQRQVDRLACPRRDQTRLADLDRGPALSSADLGGALLSDAVDELLHHAGVRVEADRRLGFLQVVEAFRGVDAFPLAVLAHVE